MRKLAADGSRPDGKFERSSLLRAGSAPARATSPLLAPELSAHYLAMGQGDEHLRSPQADGLARRLKLILLARKSLALRQALSERCLSSKGLIRLASAGNLFLLKD